MDAKRELDEFVAIHIFDWSDFWTNGILLYGHSPGERAMGIDAERSPVPHYSTDIAAAWLVVEAMRGRGLHLQMNDTLSAYRARFSLWKVPAIGIESQPMGRTTNSQIPPRMRSAWPR